MFTEEDVLQRIKQATDVAFEQFKNKKYDIAEIILNQILKINPEDIHAVQLLGLVKHSTNRYQEAIELFLKSIELNPNDFENYNNMGLCFANVGKYDESIKWLKKALEVNPHCAYLHSNLGLQFRHQNKIDEAIKCFKQSIEFDEKSDLAWGMLGGCYGETKNYDEAEYCFKKAIEINPNFAGAHVDLANVYHFKGEWEKAWPEYEWRHGVFEQLKIWQTLYDPNKKWNGECLKGKRIIVYGEQGFGDTIQFFRYVQKLKDTYIILHCNEDLACLFTDFVNETYIEEPTAITRESLPKHDYHCSILSLPYLLKLKEIPSFELNIKESLKLDDYSDKLKIGIIWAGNPQHPNDINRSCQLQLFREIHDIPNVKLFSLVKDIRPRIYRFDPTPIDLTEGTDDMKIVDMAPFMNKFIDTAAIINALDLIVTVDTAILHLAGSMGKRTLAVIAWNCDWRWLQEGQSTIWYPSVKLFRQPIKGDWKSVFLQIKKEIQNEP